MIRYLLAALLSLAPLLALGSPAHAATAYVTGCANASGAGSTTIACTMGGAVSATGVIVGAVSWDGTTNTATCADGTNTYTMVANTRIDDATNNRRTQGFYAENVAAGTPTITCTISASVNARSLVAHAVSGTSVSGSLDVSIGQNQQNPGAGTDAITSTAVTTTAAGDYIFGASADTAVQCPTFVAGTNFTIRDVTACAGIPMGSEGLIQGGAASIAGTFTVSGCGVCDYNTVVLTFKAAGGGTRRGSAPIMLSRLEEVQP